MTRAKILLVDDEPSIRLGFSKYLESVGFHVTAAASLQAMRDALGTQRFDVILLDLGLPDGHGLDVIPQLRLQHPEIVLIVITASYDVPLVVDAMRSGADDFLTKPIRLPDLEIFLRKSLELGGHRRHQALRQRLASHQVLFFGESEISRHTMDLAQMAAENGAPVLLQGETGSGKGVLARWIHEQSARCDAPFVEVNCSSLRGEMLASELFGHVKGAFTSASQERRGLLDVADGGTLFLDEVGDMDLSVQAQFLKVIEEKNYRRLGDVRVRKSDFRLICATHRDLSTLVELQPAPFRRDLFFRIHVFPILLPTLRERHEEIPALVSVLLKQLGRPDVEVDEAVNEAFLRYSWPGNIRELRNVLERAILLSRAHRLTLAHFPGLAVERHALQETHASPTFPETALIPLKTNLAEDASIPPVEKARGTEIRSEAESREGKGSAGLRSVEAEYVQRVLAEHGNDTSKAAKALGISRATLYRKLKRARDLEC